jgi:hypothetical protein
VDNRTVLVDERRFLNLPGYHSGAYICASLRTDGKYYSGLFQLANCDRSLQIALDLYNVNDVDNTIHKLDQIIQATTALKKGIRAARKDIAKRKPGEEEDLW